MLSCSCCSLPGVNISSTSVRKIFPLNTSTTFVVISFRVHLDGELATGGGTLRSALPKRFRFAGFFFLATDIDRNACALSGVTDGLGFFLRIPRVSEALRAAGTSSSYQSRVADFASASAFPTAWNAASVSRINCSTLSEKSSISESYVSLRLCVGVFSSSRASSAGAPMRSKVDPATIVAVELFFWPGFEILDSGDRDGESENMRCHVCASSEAFSGGSGGR